jgi:SAM-dependent methyltransferase
MTRHVRLRELLLGVEGLALLRHLYDGSDAAADRRLAEIRRIVQDEAFDGAEYTPEADPRAGYRSWSDNYDEPGNPIIAIEEPVVWGIVDELAPGRALDAACGTGRHARHLVQHGHEVAGFDLTPEMLEIARRSIPAATFAEGDLRDIPFESESFDLAVSGLAVAHLADLDGGIRELARVLRPGGRLVISVLHPFQAHLGWHAPFEDAEGQRGFVREHAHTHADYLAAFRRAGMRVRNCLEPELTAEQAQNKRRAYRHLPEATLEAYVGLPGVLVWDAEKE